MSEVEEVDAVELYRNIMSYMLLGPLHKERLTNARITNFLHNHGNLSMNIIGDERKTIDAQNRL